MKEVLFVNPDYACGKAYRENKKESYLTIEELSTAQVEIGMHGLQHVELGDYSYFAMEMHARCAPKRM